MYSCRPGTRRVSAFVPSLSSRSAALLSHVPGGWGLRDPDVLQFGDRADKSPAQALLAYRVVFYLMPFAAALGVLASPRATAR
jgi:hypothetical protein